MTANVGNTYTLMHLRRSGTDPKTAIFVLNLRAQESLGCAASNVRHDNKSNTAMTGNSESQPPKSVLFLTKAMGGSLLTTTPSFGPYYPK